MVMMHASWIILYCTVSYVQGYLHAGPGAGSRATFDAVDCTNPTRFRSTALKSVCQHPSLNQPQPVSVAMLQKLYQRKIKAVRCERRVTVLNMVCAVWSHSKLMESPDVQRLEPFDAHECRSDG